MILKLSWILCWIFLCKNEMNETDASPLFLGFPFQQYFPSFDQSDTVNQRYQYAIINLLTASHHKKRKWGIIVQSKLLFALIAVFLFEDRKCFLETKSSVKVTSGSLRD